MEPVALAMPGTVEWVIIAIILLFVAAAMAGIGLVLWLALKPKPSSHGFEVKLAEQSSATAKKENDHG